jgi:hypothetical protein
VRQARKAFCGLHQYRGDLPCPVFGCPRGPGADVYHDHSGSDFLIYRRVESIWEDGDEIFSHRADIKPNGDITYFKWEWRLDRESSFSDRNAAAFVVGSRLAGAIRKARRLSGDSGETGEPEERAA